MGDKHCLAQLIETEYENRILKQCRRIEESDDTAQDAGKEVGRFTHPNLRARSIVRSC